MFVDSCLGICIEPYVCRHIFGPVHVDMCMEMFIDLCMDTYVDSCADMRVDMCIDMCIDMRELAAYHCYPARAIFFLFSFVLPNVWYCMVCCTASSYVLCAMLLILQHGVYREQPGCIAWHGDDRCAVWGMPQCDRVLPGLLRRMASKRAACFTSRVAGKGLAGKAAHPLGY